MRYSALKVFTQGLTGNKGWKPVWRDPEGLGIEVDFSLPAERVVCKRNVHPVGFRPVGRRKILI